jgi:alkanesulfonate monooxygenase SsuD/methylene tetrahydromethanopterin reductase-like flavin-dependent oxidoreductase (luciferase family)
LQQGGFEPRPLAVHAHGYVAASTEQAVAEYYPSYAQAMTKLGRERGWGPMTRDSFDQMRNPAGSLTLGHPEQVAEKIVGIQRALGIERFMLHVSVGTLPHAQVLKSIELLGTEVAPLVAKELAG